jgi:CRISPR-associated endonuclease/helicase Cas3
MFRVCDSFLSGSHKATRKLGHEERNMGKKTFWAHKDHTLAKHLNDTGQKAARFARAFQAEDHGRIAGMLHDLGKAEEEFQKRILSDDKEGEKQPHAHHGAMLALEAQAWPIALAINGHHAGLHNRGDVEKKRNDYLQKARQSAKALQESDPSWSLPEIQEELPSWLMEKLEFDIQRTSEGWLAMDFFTRFLFSALIDADRLDTEGFEKGRDASIAARRWKDFDADEQLAKLTLELNERFETAKREGNASAEVLNIRKEVGELAVEGAVGERGLFSMAVPTGGGKTLASMLFALKHAAYHNSRLSKDDPTRFRRVIVVIPYLSIIEQTADELINIFGEDVVLEHHSQAEKLRGEEEEPVKQEKQDGRVDAKTKRRRLATENWDAPIVVTTSVQFFGSLFSRRPSKARKLHNVCQSVIIFDEVQTLPPLLMQPLLGALNELSNPDRPYGCSLLFCTATQPALGQSEDLPCGLKDIRPIIPPERAQEHFAQLARVEYEGLQDEPPVRSWDEIAAAMLATPYQQALAVVRAYTKT